MVDLMNSQIGPLMILAALAWTLLFLAVIAGRRG